MKKHLLVIPLLFISYFATSEIYSCPFSIDGEGELLQIERTDENKFLDLIYPEDPSWEIFFENNDVLSLTTTYLDLDLDVDSDFYELWTFVLNKKNLTYQWATLGTSSEFMNHPVIKGKCFVK